MPSRSLEVKFPFAQWWVLKCTQVRWKKPRFWWRIFGDQLVSHFRFTNLLSRYSNKGK
jgi:hypothetical protein